MGGISCTRSSSPSSCQEGLGGAFANVKIHFNELRKPQQNDVCFPDFLF